MWFAVPQEDAQSAIRNPTASTEGVVHFDTDSWGNRVAFLERLDPVNSLSKAYVEVDGKQHTDWTREFSYTEMNRF